MSHNPMGLHGLLQGWLSLFYLYQGQLYLFTFIYTFMCVCLYKQITNKYKLKKYILMITDVRKCEVFI
jgi:hypothetical protein